MNKKELISRWEGIGKVNLPDSPFGITEEGHSDLRGFAFLRRSEIKAFTLENCDFSHADFTRRWIQGTTFSHCVFDHATMVGVSDHNNRYMHCTFKGANFREALLGDKGTRFSNCRFEGCDFSRSLFSNAIFNRVEFVDNKIKSIDFQVSGFWDCSFTGELNDVIFRGRYNYKHQRERNAFPMEVGLHKVDFSKASMIYVGLRDNCPVEGLVLPSDGNAFLCGSSSLLEGMEPILTDIVKPEQRMLIQKYLTAIISFAGTKGFLILTRAEIIDVCEDQVLGSKLYHVLKARNRETGTGTISTTKLNEERKRGQVQFPNESETGPGTINDSK